MDSTRPNLQRGDKTHPWIARFVLLLLTTTIGQQQYRTAEVRRILGLSVTAETDVDCTDRHVGTTPLSTQLNLVEPADPKTDSLEYSLAFSHNSYPYPLTLLVL